MKISIFYFMGILAISGCAFNPNPRFVIPHKPSPYGGLETYLDDVKEVELQSQDVIAKHIIPLLGANDEQVRAELGPPNHIQKIPVDERKYWKDEADTLWYYNVYYERSGLEIIDGPFEDILAGQFTGSKGKVGSITLIFKNHVLVDAKA